MCNNQAMELTFMDERQAMLAAIINDSEDAIISKDLTSKVTSWNRAAERMFGYSEAEMLGQLIHILIPEDRRDEEDMIIRSLKRGQRVEHFETIRKTKNGRLLNVSLTISPIRNAEGVIIGASKIARDITRQKQTEERLRIINNVGKSIAAQLDIEQIVQTVTDATTQLSGAAFGAFFYNKIDSKGEAYMLYALSGASREAFEGFGMPRNTAVFRPTFEGTGIIRSDNITLDPRYGKNAPHHGMPKGHLPVISYLAVPVVSQSGVAIGGLFFGHPEEGRFLEEHEELVLAIASQAAIALDNAKLYQEINVLNRKKDQFISFASHELKTPLATLKGYMQLAASGNMTKEMLFPKLEKQVARLEGIISDLLDITKIQAGKLEMQFTRVNLVDIINESIEAIELGHHKIEMDIPHEVILATVDGQKISQVLVNLFTNAAKYSPVGTTIRASLKVMGGQVQIGIEDEGPGIPPEEREQIFNQFYRIPANAKEAKGMGLGLYISREIMEAHNGTIRVESEVGKGSTFFILFPLERPKNAN